MGVKAGILGVIAMAGGGVLMCPAADDAGRKSFPKVALSPGSAPLYAVVAMDAWEETAAYVLFDGNQKDGYKRIYVWTPRHANYRMPAELKVDSEGKFGAFGLELSNEKEKSRVSWGFGQTAYSQQEGTHTSTTRDYVTGKDVTRTVTVQASSGYRLSCSTSFAHALRSGRGGAGKGYPMDVVVQGPFTTYDTWDKVKAAKPEAPWLGLAANVAHAQVPGADDNHAKVLFRLAGIGARVMSLPEDASLTLVVAPFMEPPVYSNRVLLTELAGKGVEVDLPYGWYTFGALRFECGKFTYGAGVNSASGLHPWPIARP